MFSSLFGSKPKGKLPAYPFFIKGKTDVVFVHLTKTAGTSIRKSLKFNPAGANEDFKKHYTVTEIIDLIGLDNWQKAFTFAFVRNPWERLFSHYRFRLRKTNQKEMLGMEHFRAWAMERTQRNSRTREDEKLARNISPQKDFLVDHQGEIPLSFIGRYETLQADFANLCQKIGVKANLLHANQSLPIVNYRDFYDQHLIDLVAEFYAEDIKQFGYDF